MTAPSEGELRNDDLANRAVPYMSQSQNWTPKHNLPAAGLLFLSPYSPDFNPVGNAFSELKAMLPGRAERKIMLCGTQSVP